MSTVTTEVDRGNPREDRSGGSLMTMEEGIQAFRKIRHRLMKLARDIAELPAEFEELETCGEWRDGLLENLRDADSTLESLETTGQWAIVMGPYLPALDGTVEDAGKGMDRDDGPRDT